MGIRRIIPHASGGVHRTWPVDSGHKENPGKSRGFPSLTHSACKPNSVRHPFGWRDNHLSGTAVADSLKRHSPPKRSTALHPGTHLAVSFPSCLGTHPNYLGAIGFLLRRFCSQRSFRRQRNVRALPATLLSAFADECSDFPLL